MRLSKFSDYAMRTLIYLGVNDGKISTVAQISKKYDISRNHLVKVVHNLTTLGIVESKKGKGGGLTLKIPAKQLNLGKIIRILEDDSKLVECFGVDGQCKINGLCALKGALKKAQSEFYQVLEQYYLSDVISNKDELAKALDIDNV